MEFCFDLESFGSELCESGPEASLAWKRIPEPGVRQAAFAVSLSSYFTECAWA